MRKYAMVRERLSRTGLFELTPAPLANPDDLARAHDPIYVARFLEGTLDERSLRRIGFPWSEALVRRTLASVGGTLAASAEALDRGWSGNLAGGTHHAFKSEGSGYCVFNDIAVAIENLRTAGRATRFAVIDLDVHQGDGTASIFEHDPAVLTLSLHGENNFPFRKQTSRIDVALPDGTGDQEYLQALAAILPEVFKWHPQIVFYQSGVDPLAKDTLGRLSLTLEGLMKRDRMVLEAVRRHGVPIVITLGGGYSNPPDLTAEAHANTYLTAAAVFA
jgi:acetoin utilization deacetylase AcuC-like enzyme